MRRRGIEAAARLCTAAVAAGSLCSGRIVSIDVPRTICDGQQTQAVGLLPFDVIRALVTDVLTALPHIRAGKLRVLGVTTAKRSSAIPDVPTLEEQGLKDFDVSVFFGIVAPVGTPADVVARLNAAFIAVLQQPEVKQTLAAQGLEPPPGTTPAQLAGFMRQEQAKWYEVVKASGAKVD